MVGGSPVLAARSLPLLVSVLVPATFRSPMDRPFSASAASARLCRCSVVSAGGFSGFYWEPSTTRSRSPAVSLSLSSWETSSSCLVTSSTELVGSKYSAGANECLSGWHGAVPEVDPAAQLA